MMKMMMKENGLMTLFEMKSAQLRLNRRINSPIASGTVRQIRDIVISKY